MRFFVSSENRRGDEITILPPDAVHISRVLRMTRGDAVVVCDDEGYEHECTLMSADKDKVTVRILRSRPYSTEPSVEVAVFAALSKGEKFDFLIQKCVELGAGVIIPFLSERCVVRPDAKDMERKGARFSRIAMEASKQALRSRPVRVLEIVRFDEAVHMAAGYETALLLYEKESQGSFSRILRERIGCTRYAVMTGPEGGFTEAEAAAAVSGGLLSVSVGPRIMRCETAPLAAVSAIMYHTGNYDIGE